jgi:cytochrome c peroxidase
VKKWALGKKLFFDRALLNASGGSCADCHNPREGYASREAVSLPLRMNAPSLVNCIYNKHSFWDGRVATLEEVIQGDPLAERTPSMSHIDGNNLQRPHAWSDVVQRLAGDRDYRASFQDVFGIEQPTQDALAKAVATYLRTILSGDSLYDRAVLVASKRGSKELQTEDFEAVLDDEALARLGRKDIPRATVARRLMAGYAAFAGEARCIHCHSGWNFTDDEFHNLAIRESGTLATQRVGQQTGRFLWVPAGLKEARLIGAFRTPSLRNLPRTAPYFHDGSGMSLEQVIDYYREGPAHFNAYLDEELLAGPSKVRQLALHNDDVRALAQLLLALDGRPIPPVITGVPE